jgi:hypothetical protein
MKPLVFFMGIFSLPLDSQTICVISFGIEKVSPTVMSFFRGLGMVLVMKKKLINQKTYIKMSTTLILRSLKENSNTCKNISPTFKCLNFIFKLPQILSPIQVFSSTLNKHNYNNLAFEIHTNKSLKIMYPKNYYYPHKIIYLLIILFKDPCILLFT